MDISTTVNLQSLNVSASPSPSTEEMTSSTPSINVILLNHSHLQDLFDTNDILLQFFNYCNSRGNLTQSQCVDSAVNIYGKSKIVPAKSCKELYTIVPHNSGYYWMTAADGSIIQVYCDMTMSCGGTTGGLTRLAYLNLSTISQYCTGDVDFSCEGCFKQSPMPGCSGIVFNTPNLNLSYSHVCGIVEGRFFGMPNGFASRQSSISINDNYVDGISLTYGDTAYRTHIWTVRACKGSCPAGAPGFVGNNYSNLSPMCSQSTFQRDILPLLNENIEVRLCQDQHRDTDNEGIYLTSMNIYVN